MIQMRKKHHTDMEALRESMSKERADLERSLSDRSKALEQRRADEMARPPRPHRVGHPSNAGGVCAASTPSLRGLRVAKRSSAFLHVVSACRGRSRGSRQGHRPCERTSRGTEKIESPAHNDNNCPFVGVMSTDGLFFRCEKKRERERGEA